MLEIVGRQRLALASTFVLFSCAHAPPAVPETVASQVAAYGTRGYSVSPDDLMRATVEAFKSAEFELASANDEKRLITTKRKFSHFAGRTGTPVYRQYLAKIADGRTAGQATVTLTPRLYFGDALLTEDQYDFDYEKKIWSQLFDGVQQSL